MKEDEMDEACSMHERENKCIHGLDQKILRKEPLGRPRNRWINIKMYLKIKCKSMRT
jgi:hypothetical protein